LQPIGLDHSPILIATEPPCAPGPSVTGFRLVVALDHARGFPCCIGLPRVCMLSPIPRPNRRVHISLSSPTMAAFPDFWAGRLPRYVFRGLLSVHSRYGLHTCQVTYMTLYTRGFSRFVASTAAPIATGWSDLAGRDSHPLRNRAFARRTKNRALRICRANLSPMEQQSQLAFATPKCCIWTVTVSLAQKFVFATYR
jgi:hypothetical protein